MFKKFFQAIWSFLAGLFAEVRTTIISDTKGLPGMVEKKLVAIWDDKRTFGFLWLAYALVAIFAFSVAHVDTATTALVLGIVLYAGVPLGDLVPMLPGLGSMGFLDVLTNKANQGDGLRVFAVVMQIAAIVYDLTPLWNPAAQVQDSAFQLLGGGGVALALVAIWGDHSAVKSST